MRLCGDKAEASLVEALETLGREYELNPGDGAFYGPKLDFDVTDAIGRTGSTCHGTADFQFPIRFDLTYVDADGELQTSRNDSPGHHGYSGGALSEY